jgi:SAM-dependent methyltransferase
LDSESVLQWFWSVGFRRLRRKILFGSCPPDDFLSAIAARYSSHAFLGNAVQGTYCRQARLLKEACEVAFRKPATQIRVLDWGAGKGHNSYLLDRQGFKVTSCDRFVPSSDSSFGQEVPILETLKIQVVPLEDDVRLPFDSGSFDMAVSFGVLEHVPRAEDSMMEIRRVLRPGGVFFISFLPYFFSWTQFISRLRGNRYHERLYSRDGLLRTAKETGWEVGCVWHGQLFPKNSIKYPWPDQFEKWDRFFSEFTPLKYIATNLEAVLVRGER